jgi:hypothetical protein
MTEVFTTRRRLLAATGATVAAGMSGLILPARAAGLAPTPTMRGGANNYLPGRANRRADRRWRLLDDRHRPPRR